MKLLKKLLFLIVFLLVVSGVGVLIFAFNPNLTASLAEKVQQFSDNEGMGMSTAQRPEADGQTGLPVNWPGLRKDWLPDRVGGAYEMPENTPKIRRRK